MEKREKSTLIWKIFRENSTHCTQYNSELNALISRNFWWEWMSAIYTLCWHIFLACFKENLGMLKKRLTKPRSLNTRVFLQRGKFFPQLTNLVRINTPKAVQTESRKAFRKLPNVEQAISTLTNLKGVGTTLASGLRKTKQNIYSVFLLYKCCTDF